VEQCGQFRRDLIQTLANFVCIATPAVPVQKCDDEHNPWKDARRFRFYGGRELTFQTLPIDLQSFVNVNLDTLIMTLLTLQPQLITLIDLDVWIVTAGQKDTEPVCSANFTFTDFVENPDDVLDIITTVLIHRIDVTYYSFPLQMCDSILEDIRQRHERPTLSFDNHEPPLAEETKHRGIFSSI
jgi:hypothetical protein